MKINTRLDFQGNEIKLATPEKVTSLPDSNLFVGRTCVLISEKEVDETTISVGSIYYYNGEQWCQIEESLKIDETKINVIDDEITVHKFDTLSDAKTYINSNDKPKSVVIGSNAGITSISYNAFSGCTSLTSITIPSGVTSINGSLTYGAFYNCKSLKSITIPSSVTSIGQGAFRSCTALTSITIPDTVTSISKYAFSGCTSLTSITIPSGVTSIGTGVFQGCASLTSITIPDTVTSIASNAFSGCDILLLDNYKSRTGYPWGATILIQNENVTTTIDSNSTDRQVPTAKTVYDALSSSGGSSLDQTKINVMCDGDPELYTFTTIADTVTFINSTDTLKHVVIGENAGITSIGDYAFNGCTALTSITISSSVTSIGDSAFYGCSSLKSIIIPSGVTSIGYSAFRNCFSLKSINIPDTVTSISNYAFSASSLISITIPSGVTSISSSAFAYCSSLKSVNMPNNNVTSIGNSAFDGCSSLISIIMPSSIIITIIGTQAFRNCTSLKSIAIPSSVTRINGEAFKGCTSLTSITIPDTVTSIGNGAFSGCTSLKSITIPNGVTSISSSAFTGCDILLLDSYKSRTGYPWGATDILIQNEKVTTTIDENSTDRQVPTAKAVYNFTRPIFGTRYGFRINKNNSDPDTMVEYLYDAVGMTPAKMTYDKTTHKGTFNYGSWGNVWFIKNNRPVKLNFNGTVEAELNPNDYWKTVDGQDSELETSTNCNFMSEIPIIYVKRWEDENYNYVVVCDKQYDEDYLAYANTDKDGNLKPLYAPMFKGYKDSNSILRSIAGVDPLNNTTTSNEVTYSNNINTAGSVTGWQIEDIAKHELISDLLTLISKNTDSQTVFGNGVCQTSTRVFTGYNEVVTGTKTVKSDCGQFCGYNDNTHHVSIFHIQDFWGNRLDRCLGLITSGDKYYYKMTPENGGYVYSETITDYTNNGYTIAQDYSSNDITPPASGYVKNQSTGIFGNLPNATGASASTYYCDYYWYNSSGVRLLLLGGHYGDGRFCGARSFDVDYAPSSASVSIGASPFYV